VIEKNKDNTIEYKNLFFISNTFLTIKAPIDIGAISAYEKKTRTVFI